MKKSVLIGCIALLVCVLVFLVVFLLQGMAELDELSQKGNNLVNNSNKTEEDAGTSDDTTQDPPASDPVVPPEDENNYFAEDVSTEAMNNLFVPLALPATLNGVAEDDLGSYGDQSTVSVAGGMTLFDNDVYMLNDVTPKVFYEVGSVNKGEEGTSYKFFYRIYEKDGWSTSAEGIWGTNFIVYLSFSFDGGDTFEPYQRYDNTFVMSDDCTDIKVAIGLANSVFPENSSFRFYCLESTSGGGEA